jgi:hypothetical protein
MPASVDPPKIPLWREFDAMRQRGVNFAAFSDPAAVK